MKKRSNWLTTLFIFIFLAGGYLAFYIEQNIRQQNERAISQAMSSQLMKIRADIVEGITKYRYGLRGLLGVIESFGFENFNYTFQKNYFRSRDYHTEFPGTRGFGVIKYIKKSELTDFLKKAVLDRNGAFELKQLDEPKDPLFIIQYIEPEEDNLAAIGLDIGSESNRRLAALKSATTGQPQLTGPITLVQAEAKTKHGFLLLLPIYAKNDLEEKQNILGWVYAPLLISEILDAVAELNEDFKIDISDVTSPPGVDFYTSFLSQTEASAQPTQYRVKETSDVFGRNWQLGITPTRNFITSLALRDANRTFWLIIITTFLLTLIVYFITLFLANRLQKLKQQAAFANILNNASDGIIGVDSSFAILDWNSAADELFGFEHTQALGSPLADWLGAGISSQKLIFYFKKVAKGESIRNLDFNYQPQSDQVAQKLILNISPIYQNGIFGGATVNINNVTEINLLHEKLEQSNKDLTYKIAEATQQLNKELNFQQSIFDSNSSAIIVFNNSGNISLLNHSATLLLGYEVSESIDGVNILALLPNDFLTATLMNRLAQTDIFESTMAEAITNRHISSICYLNCKNGNKVKVNLSIATLIDSNGFVLIANDLSEQQTLQDNITLVNAAVDNAQEMLLWVNTDGSIYKANPSAAAFLHQSNASYEKLNIKHLVSFKENQTWQTVLPQIIKNNHYNFEVDFTNAKGERLHSLVSACTIEVDKKQFIYLAVRDISERLEKEKQLNIALKKADGANKAKTVFIANMSHELRTPLNAAYGFLQLLELSQLSEVQQNHISGTKSAILSLTQIVDEILEVTLTEQNQLVLEKTDFMLDELLAEIGLFLYELVGDKPLEIHFKMSPEVPFMLRGDKNKLRRILMNIGNNAVKFSERGEVLITISTRQQQNNSIRLIISVKDSGIGIEQDKLSTIFEMFNQADSGSNRHYGGLGIGLTIASQYVEFLGGYITVDSKLGSGSEFCFNISIEAATQPENAKLHFKQGAEINVLLVDDNETSLTILGDTIEQLGWNLTKSNNAEDAFTLFQSAIEHGTPFDLALIDWKMPNTDGLALSERIRQVAPVEQMPLLIMVTAHSKELFAQKNASNPGLLNGFLTKPITRAQLINTFYDAVAANKSITLNQSPSTTDKPLLKIRILVVEDNPTNQHIVKALLDSQGANTVITSGGEEALLELENCLMPFDVILMDLQMPGIDGYETTQRIRAIDKFAQLPILALTANIMPSDKEKCLACGMNGHIGKPFELSNVVQEVLLITHKFENISRSEDVTKMSEKKLNAELLNFCSVAGIDIQSAMARFNYLEALYTKSLVLLSEDLQKYANQLDDSNISHDDLKLIFHTLKSTAGALGLSALAKNANILEQDLKQEGIEHVKNINYSEFSAQCLTALTTVQELIAFLRKSDSLTTVNVNDEVDFSRFYQQLKTEVDSFNMHAIETFQAISVSLKSLSTELADELISALDKLKFNEAKKILIRFDHLVDEK